MKPADVAAFLRLGVALDGDGASGFDVLVVGAGPGGWAAGDEAPGWEAGEPDEFVPLVDGESIRSAAEGLEHVVRVEVFRHRCHFTRVPDRPEEARCTSALGP